MRKSEPQDVANTRIQQLRERLELYSANMNRTVRAGSSSTTNDGASKLSKQPKSGAALADSSNSADVPRSAPKATATSVASQKIPGPTRLVSHLKRTVDKNSGSPLNSLRGLTENLIKKANKSSPLEKTRDENEKPPTESGASVSKERDDKSEPTFAAPTVPVDIPKSPTPESKRYSDFIDTEENRASNPGGSASGHSTAVNDSAQRKTPLSTTRSKTTNQTPLKSGNPSQGHSSGRLPTPSNAFEGPSASWLRLSTAHRLWNLPSKTSDAGPTEIEHKINKKDESSEDTSTSEIHSEDSSSGEEEFNMFLEKILTATPSIDRAVQETLSKSYSFLNRTQSRGAHADKRVANAEGTKADHRPTPPWASAKHLDPQGNPEREKVLSRDPSHQGDSQRVSTPDGPRPPSLSGSPGPKPATPQTRREEAGGEGFGPGLPERGGGGFEQREIAFQGLEGVVRAMQKVYRATGLAAFPPDLPQAERAAALAAARDRLAREEAERRANPPKGASLEQVRGTAAAKLEGIARRLIRECEEAMDSLKDVEERRSSLRDSRRRLEMRQDDLKDRQKARASIADEIEVLRKQNNERAAALRDREKKHLEKQKEQSARERDIQNRISDVEQLGHTITSWLRILEDRDSNLSAKEEKLHRVQANIQRRVQDVQTYKEIKDRLEERAP